MTRVISSWFHHLGFAMQRHTRVIQMIQWSVVFVYMILLIVPVFMDFPPRQAHIFNNIALLAQFIFWGIWWPFVILSAVILGRTWCGVFCPEGSLSEWSSKKFGQNKTIPRWLKWRGWPAIAFVLTTLYGQLISVYDYAQAALLILGGSTVAAMLVGAFFGRGTRVWCRYLCPVSGVFNLLSRLAPVSFKTDQAKWAAYQGEHPKNPRCPPMINIHQLHGVSSCHMCGRCAGFRDAVTLEPRLPNEEVVKYGAEKTSLWEMRLLLYGIIGVAIGAFTWNNAWFAAKTNALSGWFIEHNILWPLNENAPWWIFTNYPTLRDQFSWLYGSCVTIFILGSGLTFGLFLSASLSLIQRMAGKTAAFKKHLAQAYLPVGAAGLFLGLTATSINLLQKHQHITFWWLSNLRACILGGAALWCLYLAFRILQTHHLKKSTIVVAFFLFALTLIPILGAWRLWFWGW